MVNRNLIRIKVVQIVYSYLKGDRDVNSAEKELLFSLEKGYDLYHYLLLLMVELTDLQERKLQAGRVKYMPSDEEKNPNTKFVDNRFIADLRNDAAFVDYVSSKKLSWNNRSEFLKLMLDEILSSNTYQEYMNSSDSSYEEDREFWRSIFKNVICVNSSLSEELEDESLYWNDDVDTVGTFVLKTIKRFGTDSQNEAILPMYKDQDDAEFAKQLFRRAVVDGGSFRAMIDENTKNWDIDRLAFMDIVIMMVALAEIVAFPSIPVKVSLNEYIEIAKVYSTPKSGKFINGILDGIVNSLKKEGKIIKD